MTNIYNISCFGYDSALYNLGSQARAAKLSFPRFPNAGFEHYI
jgi:hypothetical protein